MRLVKIIFIKIQENEKYYKMIKRAYTFDLDIVISLPIFDSDCIAEHIWIEFL